MIFKYPFKALPAAFAQVISFKGVVINIVLGAMDPYPSKGKMCMKT
jgi:hypothetical protein